MTTAPLSWISTIQHLLIDAKAIPLHGGAPSFPWKECSLKIGALLSAPELKITGGNVQFLSADKALAGLGNSPLLIPFEMSPLSGSAFFAIGREEIATLCDLTLSESKETKGFSSPQFQEGYFSFLLQKALAEVAPLQPFGTLALKIGKSHPLPAEEMLAIDVQIAHPKQTMWGRVLCPQSFHQAFKTHFSGQPLPPLESSLKESLNVSVALEIGHAALSLSQYKQISVGDFIVLDRCSFDPTTHKGAAILTLHQTPLLRARIKENSLKIVDYALYHEEGEEMSPETPDEDEFLNLPDAVPPDELPEEEEILPSDLEMEGEGDENHMWATKNGEPSAIDKKIPTSSIPMTLTVEVARMQMNLGELLQLAPGNILELPVHPEQGVDLTVNGKKVGKAELVKLGEALGIKILQIGE